MNSKPLSYDSLKTVLQYTNPNKRFLLAAHIPSIRFAEKSVPLKINKLSFEENMLFIDNFKYEIKIFKNFGSNPRLEENCWCDLTKHGFNDLTGWNVVMPGDVYMKDPKEDEDDDDAIPDYEEQRDQTIKDMQAELSNLRERLNDLENNGILDKEGSFKDQNAFQKYINTIASIDDMAVYNYHMALRSEQVTRNREQWEIEKIIRRKRETLQPLLNKKYNLPLKYKPLIQLCVTGRLDYQRIEHVEYNRKLHFAMRAIINFIFEKRRLPILVKTLEVDQSEMIRAPIGLKLKIQEIEIYGNVSKVCGPLSSIIDDSSFPLKMVHVESDSDQDEFQNFDNKIIKEAQSLIIGEHNLDARINWLPIYLNLHNTKIKKIYDEGQFSPADYINLIKSWVMRRRKIGAIFEIEGVPYFFIKDVFNLAKQEFVRLKARDIMMTIPMTENCELTISYWKKKRGVFHEFVLEMEVVTVATSA